MTAKRPPLFDFRTARQRRARAGGERFLFQAGAEGLADRLGAVRRSFSTGLWIGDAVADELAGAAEHWSLADFDDREVLDVTGGFDLAIANFSLQTINDLPGALIQIHRALKPDGLFLGTLLGGATLSELRDSFAHGESQTLGGVSPRVSPFADVRDLGALLQRAGFALPVADVERLTVRYGDVMGLMRDLRGHGLANSMSERSRKFLRRDTLAAMTAHYSARHGEGGKLKASFETIYLTGWAPHESQQQPLKPGSAKTRLADALASKEQKL